MAGWLRAPGFGRECEESPGSTEARCRVTPGGGGGDPEPQGKRHREQTAGVHSGKGETVG